MSKEFEYGRAQKEREEEQKRIKAEQERQANLEQKQKDQAAARQSSNEYFEKLRQKDEEFIEKYPAVKAAITAYSNYLVENVNESEARRYKNPHEATSGSSVFTTVTDHKGKKYPHMLLSVSESKNGDELVVTFEGKSTPDPSARQHMEQIAAALREETGMNVRLDQKRGDDAATIAIDEDFRKNPPPRDPNYRPYFTGQIR